MRYGFDKALYLVKNLFTEAASHKVASSFSHSFSRGVASSAKPVSPIVMNDVTRDKFQGQYSNRVPLDHPELLGYNSKWNQLRKENSAFGTIENGGAQGQVNENFFIKSWLKSLKNIRKAAPDTPIRLLFRAANGWILIPIAEEDQKFLLKQSAQVTAEAGEKGSSGQELLRIKAFDSQGITGEINSTLRAIKELREEGHPVSVEIAIPFSEGKGRDKQDPYPDSLYLGKVKEAIDAAKQFDLPSDAFRISLKDMVGELSAARAESLVEKMIILLRDNGMNTEIGLHCHDTGLAKDAYVAAIKVAQKEDWKVNVDTMLGKEGGFVNQIDLIKTLEKEGINLNVTQQQMVVLHQMDGVQQNLEQKFSAAKAPEVFTGEELRKYGIPGGGQGTFITAVRQSGLADKLKLSFVDTCHVVAHGLMRFGKDAGHPFPVTPGFQNKQNSALHVIGNMVQENTLKDATGNREKIQERLLQDPTPAESGVMYKNLPLVIAKFLRGKMPAEINPALQEIAYKANLEKTLPELLKGVAKEQAASITSDLLQKPHDKDHAKTVLTTAAVDPVTAEKIIDQVGRRTKPLTHDAVSQLPAAQKKAEALIAEGVIPESDKHQMMARCLINPELPVAVRDPERYREVPAENVGTPAKWQQLKDNKAKFLSDGGHPSDALPLTRAMQFFHGGNYSSTWANHSANNPANRAESVVASRVKEASTAQR